MQSIVLSKGYPIYVKDLVHKVDSSTAKVNDRLRYLSSNCGPTGSLTMEPAAAD